LSAVSAGPTDAEAGAASAARTEAAQERPCAVHPRQRGLVTCISCGSAMCTDCRVATPVGFKCAKCVGGDPLAEYRAEREKTANRRAGKGPSLFGWVKRPLLAIVAGVAVAGAAVAIVLTAGNSSPPSFAQTSTGGTVVSGSGPTSIDISVTGAGGLALGGTLLLPPGAGPHTPSVVIVPDDGATNRDGLAPPNSASDTLYSDLATELASQGVASLRYDRRGEGQSVLPAGQPVAWGDVVTDAQAAVKFLAARDDLDHNAIGLIGDGQGGLVSLQAAAGDPMVSYVVLISTPGRPVLSSMDDLLTAQEQPSLASSLVAQLQTIATSVAAGNPEPTQAALPGPLQPLLPANEGPYLSSLFNLNPANLASAVHVPTLIVQGGADPSLSPADDQLLAGALGAQDATLMLPAADEHTLME
ncbi:MAG: serine aminopeptidase domain-containing protein, partial [Acidimicrobiales bacterium]